MAATVRGSWKRICHHQVLSPGEPFHEQRGSIEKRLPSIAPAGDDPVAVLDADASPGKHAEEASDARKPANRTTMIASPAASPRIRLFLRVIRLAGSGR